MTTPPGGLVRKEDISSLSCVQTWARFESKVHDALLTVSLLMTISCGPSRSARKTIWRSSSGKSPRNGLFWSPVARGERLAILFVSSGNVGSSNLQVDKSKIKCWED